MRHRPSAAIVTPKACLWHDSVTVEHLLQLAPRMGPAMGDADRVAALAGRACQPVVAGITVELQDPVEAVQERLGVLSAAIGGVEVDHAGRIGTAPAAIVPG